MQITPAVEMQVNQLTLFTNNLAELRGFYSSLLGLKILDETDRKLELQVGYSLLRFVQENGGIPYHFAFNIPGYSENEALGWLRKRVEILTDQGSEIQDFSSWNARSVYFRDPDRNIVEFIARRNLNAATPGTFGPEAILGLSEIGLAVGNVRACYDQFNKQAGLPLFDGDLRHFSAIGDDQGLLICVDQKTKTWFPTDTPAEPADFELLMSSGKKEYTVTYLGAMLKITPGA